MRFFRGIAVPASAASQVQAIIKSEGLKRHQGERYHLEYRHPGQLEQLFNKVDLTRDDTQPEGEAGAPAICACGEISGASYYAWEHNRKGENTTPILIEFEVPEDSVSIDGRDFMTTVFSLGEPGLAAPVLERVFGRAILKYAEKAWNSADPQHRLALSDLARHDPDVIRAHHANAVVLGGRFKTAFRSAFIVKIPSSADAIVGVWSPEVQPTLPEAEVLLGSVLVNQRKFM